MVVTEVNQYTGTWTIDPSHTTVGFTARHLMISKVRGRFGSFAGQIVVNDDVASTSVTATIDTASIDTGDEKRDGHLRSADFFDVDTFPTMTFASTAVRERGDGYVLVGDLTIKGVTRPVELAVEFEGSQGDPWGGTRIGFVARGDINRKDWGLEWNVALETGGVLVSDKITLQLEVEAVKA
jgi:polyisoprenoid-binding protein YceI